MIVPDKTSRAVLDSVAARLYSLGRHDDDELDASARLNCLLAAGHLAEDGAPLVTVSVDGERTLRTILADLANLPAAVFARDEVLDAARAVRTAVARIEDAREYLDR